MKRRTLAGGRKGPMPDYVPHPRFGAKPRVTGLDPDPSAPGVHLHYNTHRERAIPGTAVAADQNRQTPATIPVSHYYDIERTCRDCGRPYLFFAEEQKYWYESLGFSLDSDCVRCYPCRRRTQDIQRRCERYETLVAAPGLDPDADAELATIRLDLVEEGIFSSRQLEHVRAFLNRHPAHALAARIRERVEALESRGDSPR